MPIWCDQNGHGRLLNFHDKSDILRCLQKHPCGCLEHHVRQVYGRVRDHISSLWKPRSLTVQQFRHPTRHQTAVPWCTLGKCLSLSVSLYIVRAGCRTSLSVWKRVMRPLRQGKLPPSRHSDVPSCQPSPVQISWFEKGLASLLEK